MQTHCVFVTGGTGYVGRPLIARLIERGHSVRALARPASAAALPSSAVRVIGDALDATTYGDGVAPADTIVHLVGTPHPNPRKAREFIDVDLASVRAAVDVATRTRVAHFIYLSVAHPAPVMRAYIAVREQGEALVHASGIPATILRPWYVLGPGHRWPVLLKPIYALFEAAAGDARFGAPPRPGHARPDSHGTRLRCRPSTRAAAHLRSTGDPGMTPRDRLICTPRAPEYAPLREAPSCVMPLSGIGSVL